MSYLYHRGYLALGAGDVRRCREDWESVLAKARRPTDLTAVLSYFDELLNAAGSGRGGHAWYAGVRAVCETNLDEEDLVRLILFHVHRHGIKSPVAEELMKELGGVPVIIEASAPATAEDGKEPLFEKLSD